MDRASYHKSKGLIIPTNIKCFYLPPRAPEMNPVELMWGEIRKRGFKNKVFASIGDVVVKFYEVIETITHETVRSITLWSWIEEVVVLGFD
jgi:putative transposase